MRSTDLAFVLVGLAVLGLTAAALATLEARDDRVGLRFEESGAPLAEASAEVAGAAGALLNWTLPDNATSVHLELLVEFQGQAAAGGTATVEVQVLAPDGSRGPPMRVPMAVAPGATSASVNLTVEHRWMETPERRHADPDTYDGAVRWEGPLSLRVVVEAPADLPLATYGFSARASGEATAFHQA
ncbi:MAG TPA: hypothetical protein VI796_04390 [Candidatus Thermoplasmatota archaeon]|nr:hypothetical protein [Candidatus Thermoplasmatota archaeon]